MSLKIEQVRTRKEMKEFIHLPAKIHKSHANWVPPVYMDEWPFFNPKKNKSFSYSDTVLFLAKNSSGIVGRVMGIINKKYNAEKNENDGRFCFLETYNDQEVADALLNAVGDWARSKGMRGLVGPLGFSDKDPQGLLVEGFDQPVVIASACNFPYMVDLVENFGFTKKVDLVVYKVNIPESIPGFYQQIYERALRNNPDINIVELKSKKQIKPYIRPVLSLMNETFRDIYAFAPLELKEMDDFAKRYMMILDPRFLKIIENADGEVVAFILAIPDICDGIKKSKGYVLPFGFIHILRSQRKTKMLSLLLGGIKEKYRNSGLDTIMGIKMLESAQKAGIEFIDSHLELETNLKMHAEMEKMGGVVYKRFRIFQKPL